MTGGVTQLGASDEHYTRQVPLTLELQESPALSESLVLCQGELTYSMRQRDILCPICQLQSRDQSAKAPHRLLSSNTLDSFLMNPCGIAQSSQVSFIYRAQNHKSQCLRGLYNLYSP